MGHIMQAFYGGSGLNMTFVELAIVQFNKHAFVRQPHYLFADKTLHLPSVNQMPAPLGKKEFSKARVMASGKMKFFSWRVNHHYNGDGVGDLHTPPAMAGDR